MRILIYSINYFPELTGIGKYNAEMAEWLAGHGHEVEVITAPPYYPWWRVQSPYRSWAYRTELINKVKVYRCPIWVPRKPNGIKRLLHLISFALTSIPLLLMQIYKRPDVIVVLEPTLFCVPATLVLARLSGTRSWLHVQDFEIDAAFGLGMFKGKRTIKAAERIECWLMNCFDCVSTISESMLERLSTKGVAHEKRILLTNWVDAQDIFPLPAVSICRAELGIDDDVCVALYSGNMGEKQGLEVLLDAARALQHEHGLVFVLCGDGAARERLMKMGSGLPNVLWLSLQPTDRLNELLNLADVHLLPQRADVADMVMPSKLLGMLASGRPVLATAHLDTQIAKVVLSCGRVVEPSNTQEFVLGLLELYRSRQVREKLGSAARQAALAWDKTNVLQNFEFQLRELCI